METVFKLFKSLIVLSSFIHGHIDISRGPWFIFKPQPLKISKFVFVECILKNQNQFDVEINYRRRKLFYFAEVDITNVDLDLRHKFFLLFLLRTVDLKVILLASNLSESVVDELFSGNGKLVEGLLEQILADVDMRRCFYHLQRLLWSNSQLHEGG